MTTQPEAKGERAWTRPVRVEFVRVSDSTVEWIANTWAAGADIHVHTVSLPESDQELRMIKINRGDDGWEYVPENGVIVRDPSGLYSAYTQGDFFEKFSLSLSGHRAPRDSGIEMTIVPPAGQNASTIASTIGRLSRGSMDPSSVETTARIFNDQETGTEARRLVQVLRNENISEVNIRKALAKGL